MHADCLPRQVLTEYLSVLSGAAAALVAPPEVPSTALRGPPALPYALEALRGAALEDGSTTVASLVEAVALIASNLACNNSVTGQCERSFDRITDALSQCFCQLPLTISTAEMAECVHRAEDRLAAPRELMLMPRVALQTVLTLLAKDVPPAAAAAASGQTVGGGAAAAEFATRLSSIRWLTAAPHEFVELHHALSLSLLSIRRAVAGSGCALEALLPPPSAQRGAAEGESYLLIEDGTFDIVHHDRSSGRTLLVHQPAADGLDGDPTAFAAYVLFQGARRGLEIQTFPLRVRLSLHANGEELEFSQEDVVGPLPMTAGAPPLATQAHESLSQIQISAEPPPWLRLTQDLQRQIIEVRGRLHLPPVAELQLDRMLTELEFWILLLKGTSELRGWKAHKLTKPHASQSQHAYAGLREYVQWPRMATDGL